MIFYEVSFYSAHNQQYTLVISEAEMCVINYENRKKRTGSKDLNYETLVAM